MVTYTHLFDAEFFEGHIQRHSYPWHFHHCYTLVIVDNGCMTYFFPDSRLLIESQQVAIINPFQTHCNSTIGTTACSYRVLFLPIDWINSPSVSSLVQFDKVVNKQIDFYQQMSRRFDQLKRITDKQEFMAVANGLVADLLSAIPVSRLQRWFDQRLMPAIEHIENHLDEKLSIEQLAALCHLSRFHFQRLFKKSLGLTVWDFIQQSRMEQSRHLLRSGETPAQTSAETGYFDQSHFHRQFKRMYALTPAALVKTQR